MQKTVTYRQLVFTLFIVIITISVITASETQALSAGHGAWLPLIATGLIFGIQASLIVKLNRMFESKTLFEYSGKIAGKFTAYILALLYYFHFQITSTSYCIAFFEIIKTNFLPKSPSWFLLMVSMPFLGFIAYKGLKNTGRLAEIVGIIFLVVSAFLFITMFFEGRLEYILPLYNKSETGKCFGAIKNSIDQFVGISLLTLIPVSKGDRKMPKVVFFTMVGIALFYVLDVYGCYAMIGLDEIKHYHYPLIDALRLIDYEKIDFLQRVDITYQTIGFIRVFVAKGIVYLAAVEYAGKIFARARRLVVVIVVGLLFFVVDVLALGIPDVLTKLVIVRTCSALIVSFIIPITLLIMAKVKQFGKTNG